MEIRLARQAAMCLYYERELYGAVPEVNTLEQMGDVLGLENPQRSSISYIENMLEVYDTHKEQLDAYIAPYCKTWKFERLAKVDLSILRLAVAELYFISKLSYKIVINEAVEIAKQYAADKSPGFINGVLGALIKEHPPV